MIITKFETHTQKENSKPIKILFFIESLYQGGKERQLVELLKQFIYNNDFRFELVIMRKDIFYSDINKLELKIHVIERKYLKKDPTIFLKFYNITKTFNPDIVHVWGNMTALYSIFAKILLKFKLLNYQIQDAPAKHNKSLFNQNVTFHFSDLIIANSYAGLLSYDAPNEKSNVIYNGFDFNRLENLIHPKILKTRYDLNSQYIVAMIARFSDDKDYATYIKAAQIVLENGYNVTFLAVGSGDKTLYQKLVKPKYAINIKLFDEIEDIESLMNICDIGVLSTYTEGISNTIMEFMALSKPVIATDGGGTNELIIDGVTGILIPQKSPELLANKILYLLDNPDIVSEMGQKGYENIKNNFDMSKMVNDFKNIYTSLIPIEKYK